MSTITTTRLERHVGLTDVRQPARLPLLRRPEGIRRGEVGARPARLHRRLVRLLWMALLFSPYVLLPLMPVVAVTLWVLGID